MSRTILIPLDGSAGSETALSWVAELAQAERPTIRLLRVMPVPRATVTDDGRVLEYADQESARVVHAVSAYLQAAAAPLTGANVELMVRFGDPVTEIVAEARSRGVDLVAMASHRRTGLRRLVEGSVAERVQRAAGAPVLVVSHGDRPAGAPAAERRGHRHLVRRRFWCAWSQREVEVELEKRGLPGIRWMAAVMRCSAFDRPTAIQCRRLCLDSAFRRQWPPALPVIPGGASQPRSRIPRR